MWPFDTELAGRRLEEIDEVTHLNMRFNRMAKTSLAQQLVVVAPAVLFVPQVAALLQLSNYALGSTLRYPDALCDVSEPDVGVFGDAEQNVGVIGEKSPVAAHYRTSCDPSSVEINDYICHMFRVS